MVDGVNFNPFTGKALSAEEIQQLDANKDGIVSYEELQDNMSWLASQAPDDEGEVQIDDGVENNTGTETPEEPKEPAPELDSRGLGIYNAALNNGAERTADDAAELETFLTKVESQYIEKIIEEAGVEDDASNVITYLRNQKAEFLNEYLQDNPEGPYDMEAVSAAYIQAMDEAFTTRQEGVDAFNEEIETKKEAAGNFEVLYSDANNVGNYMDPDEYQALKDKAVDYIIGQLLTGEIDEEFLTALNPKYKNNINYINAYNAIKTMQAQTDPAKMQEYLEKAEEAIAKLIGPQNTDGSSYLTTAINTKHDNAEKAEQLEALQNLADQMAEKYSTQIDTRSDAGQKDLDDYTTRLNNAINEFLENYEGTGDIEEEFKKFFDEITAQYEIIEYDINSTTTRASDGDSLGYNNLVSQVESAGAYITDEEEQNIIDAATDLFMNTMVSGDDTSIVEEIYPNFESNPDYLEAKALFDGLATSATPKEDYEKIRELLNNMLKDYGVDNIVNGVKSNEAKNVNLSPDDIAQGIWGYGTNDTYGGDNIIVPSFNIDENGTLTWTNSKDKGDIEKILQQLEDRIKAELKAQLGDMYDEAAIEQYFDDAVLETLIDLGTGKSQVYGGSGFASSLFSKINGDGNSVTVEAFVDGIISNFNEIATKGLKGETGNDGTLDRTQVLKDSGAVDDYASGENKGSQYWKSSKAKDSAKNLAKSKLEMLRSALISQAQAILGDKYVASDVTTMIDQAINETVNSYEYWDTKGGARDKYAFNAKEMYDNFFDNFEEKLNKYKKEKEA